MPRLSATERRARALAQVHPNLRAIAEREGHFDSKGRFHWHAPAPRYLSACAGCTAMMDEGE